MSGVGKNIGEANRSKGKIKTEYQIYLFLGPINSHGHHGYPWPSLLLTLELLPCSGPTYLYRREAPLIMFFQMDFRPWKDCESLFSPIQGPPHFLPRGLTVRIANSYRLDTLPNLDSISCPGKIGPYDLVVSHMVPSAFPKDNTKSPSLPCHSSSSPMWTEKNIRHVHPSLLIIGS